MSRKTERDGTQLVRLGGLLLAMAVAGGLGCGGGGLPPPPTNHAPVAKAAAATSPVIMGQTTQLSTQASDADGDSLSYLWAQTAPASPQGSFSAQSSSSTSWTAPTVTAATPFTLSVTVSDGHGGTVTSTVTVYAKTSADASFLADVMPILDPCSGCHTATQPAGALSLTPEAAYAALVNVPAKLGCTTQLLVKPGDPDSSVLIERMAGSTCGERMGPPANPTYFDTHPDQLNLVRTWIQQGAANN